MRQRAKEPEVFEIQIVPRVDAKSKLVGERRGSRVRFKRRATGRNTLLERTRERFRIKLDAIAARTLGIAPPRELRSVATLLTLTERLIIPACFESLRRFPPPRPAPSPDSRLRSSRATTAQFLNSERAVGPGRRARLRRVSSRRQFPVRPQRVFSRARAH